MTIFGPALKFRSAGGSSGQYCSNKVGRSGLARTNKGFIGACLLTITGCNETSGTSSNQVSDLPRIDAVIAAKRVLTRVDVLQILQEYASYKAADQFSPPFDASVLRGKTIVLIIKATSDDSEIGFVPSYDVATQTLTVDMPLNQLMAVSMLDDSGGVGGVRTEQSFALTSNNVVTGNYQAQNAFGASVTVEQHTISEDGIAEFRHFNPAQNILTFRHWKAVLAPAAARALAPLLKIRVTANVTPGRESKLVTCTERTVQPTFDRPQQMTYHSCYVSVDIQKIELIGLPSGVLVSQSDD